MPWKKDKDRIRKNKKKLKDYKKTVTCKFCGLDDHRVIDFHHLKDKTLEVSTMVGCGYSWKTVLKEIDKCIPICSNCHRIEHYELID